MQYSSKSKTFWFFWKFRLFVVQNIFSIFEKKFRLEFLMCLKVEKNTFLKHQIFDFSAHSFTSKNTKIFKKKLISFYSLFKLLRNQFLFKNRFPIKTYSFFKTTHCCQFSHDFQKSKKSCENWQVINKPSQLVKNELKPIFAFSI